MRVERDQWHVVVANLLQRKRDRQRDRWVTALHNTSMALRSGTVTIGGQTVTVQQVGFNPGAVTDLDGDGLSDLVWQNRSTGALAMWTIRGNSVISTQWLNAPALADPAWRIGGTGDINGDGFADLVWQNSNDGTLSAWLMHGTQYLAPRCCVPRR